MSETKDNELPLAYISQWLNKHPDILRMMLEDYNRENQTNNFSEWLERYRNG